MWGSVCACVAGKTRLGAALLPVMRIGGLWGIVMAKTVGADCGWAAHICMHAQHEGTSRGDIGCVVAQPVCQLMDRPMWPWATP